VDKPVRQTRVKDPCITQSLSMLSKHRHAHTYIHTHTCLAPHLTQYRCPKLEPSAKWVGWARIVWTLRTPYMPQVYEMSQDKRFEGLVLGHLICFGDGLRDREQLYQIQGSSFKTCKMCYQIQAADEARLVVFWACLKPSVVKMCGFCKPAFPLFPFHSLVPFFTCYRWCEEAHLAQVRAVS